MLLYSKGLRLASRSALACVLGVCLTPGVVKAADFVIEAEDFNFGAGQHLEVSGAMPYLGGSYQGLSAQADVDYHRGTNDPAGDLYRSGETPNVPLVPGAELGRSTWVVTNNHRVASPQTGDWYNYTRGFPAGHYQVLAALCHPGTEPDLLRGSLQQVLAGSDSPTQTLQELGTFSAPGTGTVDQNDLVELRGVSGQEVLVYLEGPRTLRYTAGSGDIDYLLLRRMEMPQVVTEPADLVVLTGGSATFSVTVANPAGCAYQWLRNGSLVPDATNASYSLAAVTSTDHGSRFRCRITNIAGTLDTREALLNVQTDLTPPALSAVVNLGDPRWLTVFFSEPVDAASATNASHYALNHGASVLSAAFAGDGRTVVLRTTPLQPETAYTLLVSSVRDLAPIPNLMPANTPRDFSLAYPPLDAAALRGIPEPLGPSSRSTALVISELMYDPPARPDGLETEFLELYNSDELPLDLSGFSLAGEIAYTFPPQTVLASRGFLVVAPMPGDVKTVYGITNVVGGFTNRLGNAGGSVRLRNSAGAVLLEVPYRGGDPWPEGAEDTGHSLVLARPSYGEADPRAWGLSDSAGGSPGRAEAAGSNPHRTVFLNEVLAHTDDPVFDFVELFNYAATPVDLSGCILTDDPTADKFVIPTNTTLAARGHLAFDQNELGFALDAGGETVYCFAPGRTRLIDVVRFGGQENGVSLGRSPDGAPGVRPLLQSTPGTANALPRQPGIVINEIMFNPPEGDLDEFVELLNTGTEPVDLTGWRLEDAVQFTFPTNFILSSGQTVVVASRAARLRTNHVHLTPANTLGDYQGSLGNGGERLVLTKPDRIVGTNHGVVVTNTIHIRVDAVPYSEAGRWSQWADGGGSSLELIDPAADRRLSANWADSDESSKSPWITVQSAGVLDLGQGLLNELQVMLLGAGECLVDNLEVTDGAGNRVANGGFESGLAGWVVQGNHVRSGLSAPGRGDASPQALHLRATSGGDNGANRLECDLTSPLSAGASATMRGRARWLRGHPDLLLRLHGNALEAVGRLPIPRNLGTPAAVNSRWVSNAPPAILEVAHTPAAPRAGQTVTLRARVVDPDGLARLAVQYRADPATNLTVLAMTYHGAGLYSATLPGYNSGTLIAFHLVATDTAGATARFPADAPAREGLVRWGDPTPAGGLGVYRFWMTGRNASLWTSRERLSNEPIEGTFVYGNDRVVYNAGARYRGSPFIRPGYSGPTGAPCAYVWTLPEDEPFLGADELNLDSLEPTSRDVTALREVTSYWMADQLGLPRSHQRFVHLVVQGVANASRGIPIYADSEQPDGVYVRRRFADDPDGEIFKIDDWFEFDDAVAREFNVNATLQVFTTTGGVKKQARYRWNWEKKFNHTLDDDYTRLFALVDAMNAPDASYVSQVTSMIDVDVWIKVFALRHAVGDWDGYGYSRGKNQTVYKPRNDRWKMLLWDLDFSLGCSGGHAPNQDLFTCNDPVIQRLYNHPHFRRLYLEALRWMALGPMESARVVPFLTARYEALRTNGVTTTSPFVGSGAQGLPVPDWISQRRTYILGQLSGYAVPFAITSNGGNDFATNRNLLTLSGTASLEIHSLRINGVDHPLLWTSPTNWSVSTALGATDNRLVVEGLGPDGRPVNGATDVITITCTASLEAPEGAVVLNEIQYNPALPGAGFVELHNRSTTTAFNLTGYRIDGADFAFAPGTLLGPGGFLVVAANPAAFVSAYGNSIALAGTFAGQLDNGGEALRLLRPGLSPGTETLVDEVTYDDDPPWPALADGYGPSLQLVDPAQDNQRVANWAASLGTGGGTRPLIGMTDPWRYDDSGANLGTAWKESSYNDNAWRTGAALLYVEDAALPAAKNTLLTRGAVTFYFRKPFTFSGNLNQVTLRAQLILDDGAVIYLNGHEALRIGMNAGAVSFTNTANRVVSDATLEGPFLLPATNLVSGTNVLAVEVHQNSPSSSDIVFGLALDGITTGAQPYTPGTPNAVATSLDALPELWLNEVQPANSTGPVDNAGERDPWAELYYSGATALSLSGFYLSDTPTDLLRWSFPAGSTLTPGTFRLVWLDGQPTQSSGTNLHTSFRLPTSGSLFLSRVTASGTNVIDYLHFPPMNLDRSFGALPDGATAGRSTFYRATPGAPNDGAWPATPVVINEWLAGNSSGLVDPADGDFDDWFELHNPGPVPVDLSGYSLTDSTNQPTQWLLPTGSVIPPQGFLIIWADGETHQNSGGQFHAPFRLSLNGETLALYAPNGAAVDVLAFGVQTNDVSQGRWPDASAAVYPLALPTPGAANVLTNTVNHPPTLYAGGDRAVNEGSLLAFAPLVIDPDPGQGRTFSLEDAPVGASVNPDSGVFTWTPTEAQGPGVYTATLRVVDQGDPPLSDAESFTITVHEVNQPPVLAPLLPRTITEGTRLTFTAAATDPDLPLQDLTYGLDLGAPPGAVIDSRTGLFQWTPDVAQGPGVYAVTIVAMDEGTPPLNASQTVMVTVLDDPSVLAFESVLLDGAGSLTLRWTTQAGRTYRLEARDELGGTPWIPVATQSAGAAFLESTVPTTNTPHRFYRVVRVD